MSRPERSFDWHRILYAGGRPAVVADPRRRMSALQWLFLSLVGLVAVRCLTLEFASGSASRSIALRVPTERIELPATRGPIVDRTGTVLGVDQQVPVIKIHYRHLQQPLNASWLRQEAARLLPARRRRDAALLDATTKQLSDRIQQMHARLAVASGMSSAQWQDRRLRIQSRIERMADNVNRRRIQQLNIEPTTIVKTSSPDNWATLVPDAVAAIFAPPPDVAPRRITIKEQLRHHLMLTDVSAELVADIAANQERYPGVVVQRNRLRTYPLGSLAAHAIGYTTSYAGAEYQGRAGIERDFDDDLQGVAGFAERQIRSDSGCVPAMTRQSPTDGNRIHLTIDARLQRTAERLLDDVCRLGLHQRRRKQALTGQPPAAAGGSVVVIDIHTGDLLALASAPRFDPNDFSRRHGAAVEHWLRDPQRPMFDRSIQMAITPGSVFKPLVAVAMLQMQVLDPDAPFVCRGYHRSSDRQRCQLYVRHGVGHGATDLHAALAQSCNTYFYHHAEQLGSRSLIDWALRFGMGRPTGIELAGESSGHLPSLPAQGPTDIAEWSPADTAALAIGQGKLTVTPIQMARAMAAIANDGVLVTPRLVSSRSEGGPGRSGERNSPAGALPLGTPVVGLRVRNLATVRDGLRRAVSHPSGTAHRTVHLDHLSIAGKTGTAETSSDAEDHAWFAGYVPADRPQIAFVVAIAHGGGGGSVCGPIARQLVLKLEQLGYLSQ